MLSEDLLAAPTIILVSGILYYAFLPAAPYPFQCNILAVQDQEAEGKVHTEGNRYIFDLLDMVQGVTGVILVTCRLVTDQACIVHTVFKNWSSRRLANFI